MVHVVADPYPWPGICTLSPDTTALLVIDMQNDFCSHGGYIDAMGYGVQATRDIIPRLKSVLDECRRLGFHIVHTRETYRGDLTNCPLTRQWRTPRAGAGVGSIGPMGRLLIEGQAGWDIIPELYPFPDEVIVNKSSRGAFYSTDLDLILRQWGVSNLILTGVTTDVCVHSTMREADDRGYDCLLLEDCTHATEATAKAGAILTIKTEGGVFGAVSNSASLLQAIRGLGAVEVRQTDALPF